MLRGANSQISWGFDKSERAESVERGDSEVTDFQTIIRLMEEIRNLLAAQGSESPKKRISKKSAPIPHWQEMIAHIDTTWQRKKGSKYPFSGADMAKLKTYAKLYMAWGVMALWDCFLNSEDPFYRNTGYKIGAFASGLPKLLDMDWKVKAEGYRQRLQPPIQSVTNLVAGLANDKALKI